MEKNEEFLMYFLGFALDLESCEWVERCRFYAQEFYKPEYLPEDDDK